MHLPTALVNRLFPCRWIASILLIFLVDVATWLALSRSGGPSVVQNQDKILHVLGFFVLSCLGYVSLSFDFFPRLKRFSRRLALFNGMIWLCYGLFIEAAQSWLSYRSASPGDLLADCLGIAAGTAFIYLLRIHPKGPDDAPR